MKTRGHVAHDIQLIEMKKEYDIDRNLEDASAACVKLEEENTKIENYSEGTLKNTDSAQNLKTERDTSPVLEFKFYNTDNVTCRYYERPIPCGLCPKKFKTKDYAKRHERTHIPSSLRAKFECTLCDKHYTSNRDLKRHNETHLVETERKMHQCILCEKSFGRKSALKDHEQTHLPESERVKFTCSTCEKSFKWKKHLHRHNKTHSINIDV